MEEDKKIIKKSGESQLIKELRKTGQGYKAIRLESSSENNNSNKPLIIFGVIIFMIIFTIGSAFAYFALISTLFSSNKPTPIYSDNHVNKKNQTPTKTK